MVTKRRWTLWTAILCFTLVSLHASAYNKLSIPDVLIEKGGSIDLPVNLENDDQVVALQFMLTLPEGFTLDVNSARLTERSSDHLVRVKNVQGNDYLFMVYSVNNTGLSGNKGTVMYVSLKAPTSINEGDVFPMSMSEAVASDYSMNNVLNTSSAGTITIARYPDLVPADVTTDKQHYSPGDHIIVSWTVRNNGQQSTRGGWSEQITLVDESGTICMLGTAYCNDILGPDGIVSRQAEIVIPQVPGIHGNVVPQVRIVPNSDCGERPEAQANNTLQGPNVLLDALLFIDLSKYTIEETSTRPLSFVVTRSGNREEELIVTLDCNDSRVNLPATVTIAAGQSSVSATATLTDNGVVDDNEKATITINASGYPTANALLTIEDNEFPQLTAIASVRELTEGDSFSVTLSTSKALLTDLNVNVSCSLPGRFNYPATITIKTGETTAVAEFVAIEDNLPDVDQEVTFTFTADRHEPDEVWITLHDNDVPDIELNLTPTTVSEGAGPNAIIATLKRLNHSENAITIMLSDDSNGLLSFSSQQVSMAAGVNEVQFAIGVNDNQIVEGDRLVNVTAAIYIRSCSCQALGGQAGHVTQQLTVTDNDGPTITITSSSSIIAEGTEATLTITRNADLDKPLTVNLSSNNDTGLNYNHQVTIPAGEKSTEVIIAVNINDQLNDDHLITLQASADGFSTGTCWVMIANQTLPDAQITSIELSKHEVEVGEEVEVTVTVSNTGSATLPAQVRTSVYLNGDITLARMFTIAPLEPGESQTMSKTFPAPDRLGTHQLFAIVNDRSAVQELITGNNTSEKINFTISAPFSTTLSVDKPIYVKGETVSFTGKATGNYVLGDRVEIYIINNGSRQTLSATIDADGNFTAEYMPLAAQMGHFIAGACYPGENSSIEMANFDIYGITAKSKKDGNGFETCELALNEIYSGTIIISNPGVHPQTGLTLTTKAQSANCEFSFEVPTYIAAGDTVEINYTIKGNAISEGKDWQQMPLEITTAEGSHLDYTIYYYVHQQTAKLEANVSHINTTMTFGEARNYPVTITNVGKGDSGKITLALPYWVQTLTPKEMASLSQGDSATIMLRFIPTAEMMLNVPVTGRIGVNCANGDGTYITFQVTPVSEVNGTITVDAVDEFTFFTTEAPHVSNATVKIKRPYTGEIVAEGLTGSDGTYTVEIPEGWYTMTVTADKHKSYSNTIIVDPGITKTEEVFLGYQTVTYSWDVVETENEDEYETTLIAEFETRVPKPVIIITLPDEKPEPYNIFPVLYTNKGLLKALNVRMSLDVSDGYNVEILNDTYLDSLEAQQEYVLFARIMPTNEEEPTGEGKLKANRDSNDNKDCVSVIAEASYQEKCQKYTDDEHTEAIKKWGFSECQTSGSGGSGSSGGSDGFLGYDIYGGGGPWWLPGRNSGETIHNFIGTYINHDITNPSGYCELPVPPYSPPCDSTEQKPLLNYKRISAKTGESREGVAADGISQIKIVLTNGSIIPNSNCYSYSYEWKLKPNVGMLSDGSVDSVVYTAPRNFPYLTDNPASKAKVTIEAIMTYTNNKTGELDSVQVPIEIIRAPVLFVHGLNSDRHTWDKILEWNLSSNENRLYQPFQIEAADYSTTHNETFNTNFGYVKLYAMALLSRVNHVGYEATKIDAVGHSMGGLLIKKSIQEDNGGEFIQRVITLNTPHGGSQFGDFMTDSVVQYVRDIRERYELVKFPLIGYRMRSRTPHYYTRMALRELYSYLSPNSGDINNGAVSDLSVKGDAIASINNDSTHGVKCHAIATTTRSSAQRLLGGVIFGPFELGYSSADECFNELFNGYDSDYIVPLNSQQGGLEVPQVSIFRSTELSDNGYDYSHIGTTKSPEIKQHIYDLLSSDINSELFSNGFQNTGKLTFNMDRLNRNHIDSIYTTDNAELPRSNNLLQIKDSSIMVADNADLSLMLNYHYNEGDTIVDVQIDHTGEFCYIGFGGLYKSQILGYVNGDHGTIELPKKINDDVMIIYEGQATDGQWFAMVDTIRFNTIGSSHLQNISFNLDTLYLSNDLGTTVQLTGTWDDGQQTTITGETLHVADRSVAYVDEKNVISGIKQGQTTLIARYQGLECSVPVLVEDYFGESDDEGDDSESVCSTVTLSFQQRSVMTRQAFRGTLTINNGHLNAALENLVLNLTVRDEDGNLATSHEFQINCESLQGFTGKVSLDSCWTLAPRMTGVATILFIPTKYAAPAEPKKYSFGGTFSYTDPSTGLTVTRELNPVILTVNPSPDLTLDYFLQRDVYGDDPLTEEVEPMQDAEFALIIDNQGCGDATNFRMITQQPQLIENEKGLLIDYEFVSSQLNGEDANLSMGEDIPTDFGTIEAQSQAYAQWWLRSSLLGHFISYDMSYNHITSYGNEDLSLIDTVRVHELIHGFTTDDVTGKRMRGFLVNDLPDDNDLPDIIHFTNASQEDVAISSATISRISDMEYSLEVTSARSGWNYGSVIDPTLGRLKIVSVVRQSDGKTIYTDHVWTTNRTLIDGADWLYENRLHYVVDISGMTDTYIITFEPKPETELEVESFDGIPAEGEFATEPVTHVTVTFNKPIDPSTFTVEDISLTRQGHSLDVSLIGILPLSDTSFDLDLSQLTYANGFYILTVQTAGIKDTEGFNGLTGKSATWSQYIGGMVHLEVMVEPAGTGLAVPESGDYPVNSTLHMKAQASAGYTFMNWMSGEDIISNNEEFDYLLLDDAHLTAIFQALQCCVEIIYDENQGNVINGISQVCTYGTELELKAIPIDGYEFDSWRVNHRKYSTDQILVITVEGNLVIEAVFKEIGMPEITYPPYIQTEVNHTEVVITAIGDGEVLLYINDQPVANPCTISRQNEDVLITISATAQEDGKLISEPSIMEFIVPKLDDDSTDEIYENKEVASMRYFNLLGQEVTEINGPTIVVVIYTDGTTNVLKVIK